MFMYSPLEGDQSVSHTRLSQVMRLRVDSPLAVFFLSFWCFSSIIKN